MVRHLQILMRIVSAIVGAGFGLMVLNLVLKSKNLDSLKASTWFLGTVLIISMVVTSIMWWRQAHDTNPTTRRRTSVLLCSYLYGFLACGITILLVMGYLFFKRQQMFVSIVCLLLACLTLIAHWRVTTSLLQLTRPGK